MHIILRGLLALLIVMLGMVVGGLGYYGYQVYASWNTPGAMTASAAVTKDTSNSGGSISAEGTILPREHAALAFSLGGRVAEVRVKEGDRVRAGDVLVRIDDAEVKSQAAQADAALSVAQKQLAQLRAGASDAERQAAKDALDAAQSKYDDAKGAGGTAAKAALAALSEAKSAVARLDASQAAIDVADAQVKQAQAAADAAKAAMDEATLKAPFAGTVGQVGVNVGDFVGPGIPVAYVGDLTKLIVDSTDVSDLDVSRLGVGQPVQVTLEALPGKVFHGTISRISPMAIESRGYKVFHVMVDLIEGVDSGLKWGMAANIEITTDAAKK